MQTVQEDIRQLGVDSLWHALTQHKPLKDKPPMHIVRGEGCYIYDSEGNSYLDALAGLWCVNVGYGRKELAEIAKEQMTELAYLAPTMSHPKAILLADKLLKLLDIQGHVYFASSGSEANEAAFKIARQYQMQIGQYRRYKIISRHRAYHGNTFAAMTATGQAERKIGYDPLAPGFLHIPPPYPYRRHEKLTVEEHGDYAAQMLEDTIIYEGVETVAAFIMEPMISGGGVIVPPDNYIAKIRQICDRYGVVLIFDEVVSGFGRTGKLFGHWHWGIKPDIITFAKGISSGYMPLSATVVSNRIFEAFYGEANELKHFRHVNTYSAHPASTAVGLANIEIMLREDLPDNAMRMGAYIREGLKELEDHPYVGEIRGKGLLLGIETVADKTTKEPLAGSVIAGILNTCKEMGVLIGRNGNTVPGLANVLIMAPPLVLSEADADKIVHALKTAFAKSLAS
ncbi:MAG: aminotransferase [Deinococcales bacterium]